MYPSQEPFRSLHESLHDYEGEDAFADVLAPWLASNDAERRFLDDFGRRPRGKEGDWPAATDEDLCRLYAVSRVDDVLRRGLEPPCPDAATWAGPALRSDDYLRFMSGLGLHAVERPSFDPFFHEIVAATSAPEGEPVRVIATHWPALFLGNMLFTRAGCTIAAPPTHIDPSLAATSVLHWSSGRRNRSTMDLSVGWGHSSQWATAFRRDYRVGGMLLFNVDAKLDAREKDTGRRPNEAREELSPAERVELLTHRAFVRTAKPDGDLWPWDDHLPLEERG